MLLLFNVTISQRGREKEGIPKGKKKEERLKKLIHARQLYFFIIKTLKIKSLTCC